MLKSEPEVVDARFSESGDWAFSGDGPEHIVIRLPNGVVRLGINDYTPEAIRWEWNRDAEAPSITPSIENRCGNESTWHGYLTGGKLIGELTVHQPPPDVVL